MYDIFKAILRGRWREAHLGALLDGVYAPPIFEPIAAAVHSYRHKEYKKKL